MKSPSPLIYGAAAGAIALLGLSLLLFYGGSEGVPATAGSALKPAADPLADTGDTGGEGAVADPDGIGADGGTGPEQGDKAGDGDGDDNGDASPFLPEEQRDVVLFFQSAVGDRLFPELRTILKTSSFLDQAKQVVVELIAGPRTDSRPVLPPDTRLRELYLVEPGTVCIDFSRDLVDRHGGGSAAELASV